MLLQRIANVFHKMLAIQFGFKRSPFVGLIQHSTGNVIQERRKHTKPPMITGVIQCACNEIPSAVLFTRLFTPLDI